jgi:hypothetical protein
MSHDLLLECGPCQQKDEAGKVVRVLCPCVHCGTNDFVIPKDFTSSTQLSFVEGVTEVRACVAQQYLCANPACPVVQDRIGHWLRGEGQAKARRLRGRRRCSS